MKIEPLKLSGTFKVVLEPQKDERGYFMRVFDKTVFQACGLATDWVQENQSFSIRNVVRGLHFQRPPYSETKLVRALAGRVVDVFVDLRKGSATYGQWESIELSAENQIAVYIPRGFAHGFCTPDAQALIAYKVDSLYAPEAEGGLLWSDPDLAIRWPVRNPTTSPKDGRWPRFRDFITPFI
jgi:dTDP-4-dehydrorhamnose 3,5-epimerase